jgi:hypothetical protein
MGSPVVACRMKIKKCESPFWYGYLEIDFCNSWAFNWDIGSIPRNGHTHIEKDEDLQTFIHTT